MRTMLLLVASCILYLVGFASALSPSMRLGSSVNRNLYKLPDLYEASVVELQQGLDDGVFTSVELVKVGSHSDSDLSLSGDTCD